MDKEYNFDVKKYHEKNMIIITDIDKQELTK